MAYMNQEKKAKIAPKVKEILKKYNLTGRLSVDNHSTLVLTITKGALDFVADYTPSQNSGEGYYERVKKEQYIQVNIYHIASYFTGKSKDALLELNAAMHEGNHDNSDILADYFDIGWYVDINIGKWDKPYEITA